ncbi:Cys-tRNA(Pro) deacylase [Qingrenia yutianensis]|uniref:Cys-tRNA(Pro)/Cys-tRNA(Cys) deacylase n=1 Tax=Qingrenia yutianensis TaxID=2763676 RepID=A0A926ISX3_9FIRM|nr:Cys-tRNA(Pro) deacylase [Qingrenia yutianensis]MBC8596834.1 Cys-tRNA(Pro) deacylase [Qingrenia yutianensis]
MVKTNAMRLLDKAKIKYDTIEYEVDENDLSGVTIAKKANLDDKMVFKTLVAKGDKTGYLVFCIPVAKEVDLKKAAKISGNKKIEMVHVKDLLGLTGYIRGGCSPVGMKKKFDTYFDETCKNFEKITVSAGVRGCQLLLNTSDITKFTNAKINSLTMEECE